MEVFDWLGVLLFILKAMFKGNSRDSAMALACQKFGVSASEIEKNIGTKF